MSRRRRVLAALAVAAIVLVAGRALAALYVDYAWYAALGLPRLGRDNLGGAILLRGGTTLLATGFLFAHLYAVRRSVVSLVLPRQVGDLEFGEEVPGRYLLATAGAVAAIVGSFLGIGAEQWPRVLLAFLRVPYGERDPYFGNDLGFHVARLPAELLLFSWAQRLLLVTMAAVVVLYALTPSIRWEGRTLYVSEYVRRHVTILGGLLLLLFAWAFRLESYQLLLHGSGAGGAFSALDLQVRMPGALVLAATSLAAGLLVMWAGFAGQVRLAFFAVSVMLLLTVIVRGVLPIALRGSASDRARTEAPYLATRDGFTRRAFGADRVARAGRVAGDSVPVLASPTAVAVWDAPALRRAIDGAAGVGWLRRGDELHAIVPQRGFIEDGEETPWTVTRVASWTAEPTGEPEMLRPPVGGATDVLPPVITTDSAPPYRLVADPGGVVIGGPARSRMIRLAHAWALQNFRILLGTLPQPEPVIVLRPSLRERVAAVVPFFVQGDLPTPAIAGDTLFWTVDLYAASSTYPLSEPLVALGAERRYLHPAGHAVVNAATGRVRIVPVIDPEPLVTAWIQRYPELFVAEASLPDGISAALLPHVEVARARSLTYARVGPTAVDAPRQRRHLALEHGGDSVLAGAVTPAVLRGAPGLSIVTPILDDRDRVAGVVVASGPSTRARWIPAGDDGPTWGATLDALRAADSTTGRRDARPLRGRVRTLPTREGLTFVQPTYLWPARGGPTLAAVATSSGAGTSSAPVPQLGLPPDTTTVIAADPRALYERLRAALRRGDWPAFGALLDSLGGVLGAIR